MFDLLGIEIHEGNLVWDTDFGQGKVLGFYTGNRYPIMVGFKFKKGVAQIGALYNSTGSRSDGKGKKLFWSRAGAETYKKEHEA